MNELPKELRRLADQIEELVRNSSVASLAWAATHSLCDYLTLRARVIELQARETAKDEDGA
jgi:hypothetical protein